MSDTIKRYAEWSPTTYDPRGLGNDIPGEWLVAPVLRSRESDSLEKANFDAALAILGGESGTVQVHRFGHWACGWFEIIVCDPSRRDELEEIAARLDDYPCLDDNLWSYYESEENDE